MRESQIEKHLVELVKAMGGEVRKVRWIGRNGAPDRFVMLPGQPGLWIELKAPGERCRPHQIREHVRMQKMGQRVEVVDSLEGVDAVLKGNGWEASGNANAEMSIAAMAAAKGGAE